MNSLLESFAIFFYFFGSMSLKSEYDLVDLTHPLYEQVPTWTGKCGFRLELRLDYSEGLRVQSVKHHCGIGTHMDAPSHFIPGGSNIDQIPLDQLLAPICLLELQDEIKADFKVEIGHLETYTKKYGAIKKGSVVIARTGWEKYWTNPDQYRNADAEGKMHFPGFSEDCAEYLSQLSISGIGIDTLSPDGSNDAFPVHLHILGAQKFILENLANLALLPAVGSFLLALPMLYKHATEAPTRAIAFIPKNKP